MLRVDPSLFSNVTAAVQRTGSLPGGGVRGLPNGVVIDGLKGINSFGSDIAEAQKEYSLGRVRAALERVKQIEMQFNGICGRWNSTVGSVISSARQGQQKLSLQKLNEAKNAQTKMQVLTGPATKAFRDLVSALEHEVTREGRSEADSVDRTEETAQTKETAAKPESSQRPPLAPAEDETPDHQLLGTFATIYRFGTKLRMEKSDRDRKAHIVPKLEMNRFYFFAGFDPPRVVRIKKIEPRSVLLFDTRESRELAIDAGRLKQHLKRGIWMLEPKKL